MASEIRRSTKLSWTKSGAQISCSVDEVYDQTGNAAIQNVQTVSTTSETVLLGDTTPAYIMFKNLNTKWSDLTSAEKVASGYDTEALYNAGNLVYIGTTSPATSGNAPNKLIPQTGVSIIANISTYYAIAATEDVDLLVSAVEA